MNSVFLADIDQGDKECQIKPYIFIEYISYEVPIQASSTSSKNSPANDKKNKTPNTYIYYMNMYTLSVVQAFLSCTISLNCLLMEQTVIYKI